MNMPGTSCRWSAEDASIANVQLWEESMWRIYDMYTRLDKLPPDNRKALMWLVRCARSNHEAGLVEDILAERQASDALTDLFWTLDSPDVLNTRLRSELLLLTAEYVHRQAPRADA